MTYGEIKAQGIEQSVEQFLNENEQLHGSYFKADFFENADIEKAAAEELGFACTLETGLADEANREEFNNHLKSRADFMRKEATKYKNKQKRQLKKE